MDRKEFERRYGTEQRYATVIYVPHGRALFRKLKISHRLIVAFLIFLSSIVVLSGYFAFMYFANVRDELIARSASTKQLEQELGNANATMLKSVGNMERLTRHLLIEERQREQQLADLQARYESLRALTAGQEKLAEAYRAILERRTFRDRFIDMLFAFSVGVVSSLVANILWRVHTASPVSDAEAEALKLDE